MGVPYSARCTAENRYDELSEYVGFASEVPDDGTDRKHRGRGAESIAGGGNKRWRGFTESGGRIVKVARTEPMPTFFIESSYAAVST